MDNPYQSPQGHILETTGSAAPKTWKEILFSFEGRIPRRTYWGASFLAAFIFGIPYGIAAVALNESLAAIVSVLILIPYMWVAFAISTKRWHDRDKSGWWNLIAFVPIIGGIWAFVECGCLRGTQGANQYGQDPT